jgi:hypothetical protein
MNRLLFERKPDRQAITESGKKWQLIAAYVLHRQIFVKL